MMRLLAFLLFVALSSAFESYPGIQDDPMASPPMKPDFVGDMKLTKEQLKAIENGEDAGPAVGAKPTYSISNRATHRWPNAVIPYNIDCSLENIPSAIHAVKAAMAEWESKTCIRFVQHTNEVDYLTFHRNTHCWGHVGRIGGESKISVGPGCDYQHVMTHEIGHVVGFYHEQNRLDRDTYVDVLWDNINEWVKSAFRKVKESYSLGVPYDYASIMHYPWSAFSKNGKATMRPLKTVNIQPYISLSAADAQQTSLMYNCKAISRKKRALGDCDDKHTACAAWAKAGYCSYSSVIDNCELSCKAPQCDLTIPCVDQHSSCPDWARIGHCKLNPTVNKVCPKSCHPRCKNVTPQTPPPVTDAPQTQAPLTPPPVTDAPQTQAPQTQAPHTGPTTAVPTGGPLPRTKDGGIKLGYGKLCKDRHSKCQMWANNGECKKNPGYMHRKCQISCNVTANCDRSPQKPPGSCADPLGISFDGKSWKIPDSSMKASSNSELAPGGGWVAAAKNARLYFEDDYTNKRIAAWCIKSWDDFNAGQYLEIDLGAQKNIQYIATQGRDKYFERVSKFKVKYSSDGSNWSDYSEGGKVKEFAGNCDYFTPILNKFNNMISARYFRYYPTRANYPCVRLELYGC